MTPYFQHPFELGADIIIHSGTKFLGGHNDTPTGFIVVNSKELSEKLRFIIKTVSLGLAPFDSWLILRSIKMPPLRMKKSQENAKAIVEFLTNEKRILNVYYLGIKGTKGYDAYIIVTVMNVEKKIKITEEEYQAVKIAAKKNKHKRIDKKLQVIILRYEGITCEEIGIKLGYSKQCVSRL